MKNWQILVERYADGREVCNCRNAYYTPCGKALVGGVQVNNYPVCEYGCSSNQLRCKEEIAGKVLQNMNKE